MAVNYNFDASKYDPLDDYSSLPAGDYVVAIVDSEKKETKDGRGSYLQLTLEVLEGEYKGRELIDRLNLSNPNPIAVDIAKRTLSSICRAVGKMRIDNTSELHGVPIIAKVSVRPPSNGYGASNDIKSYMAVDRGVQQQTQSQASVDADYDDDIPF